MAHRPWRPPGSGPDAICPPALCSTIPTRHRMLSSALATEWEVPADSYKPISPPTNLLRADEARDILSATCRVGSPSEDGGRMTGSDHLGRPPARHEVAPPPILGTGAQWIRRYPYLTDDHPRTLPTAATAGNSWGPLLRRPARRPSETSNCLHLPRKKSLVHFLLLSAAGKRTRDRVSSIEGLLMHPAHLRSVPERSS